MLYYEFSDNHKLLKLLKKDTNDQKNMRIKFYLIYIYIYHKYIILISFKLNYIPYKLF